MNNNHHGSRCLCYHHNCYHGEIEIQGYQRELVPDLAGAIFFCNSVTRKECFRRKLFGLPACREHFVRQVEKGMFLFLFDTDNRMMYGVFVATSNGDMNIVPDAYRSTGKTYPAQVQFAIKSACRPLTEPEFKSAILLNYFTDVKFKFELNFDQVQRLLVLFEEKKVRRVSRPITERCTFRRSSTSSDLDILRNHNQGWYSAANTNLSRYASDRAQYESHIRDQVHDNGSQDQRKSVFSRLAPKREREAQEEEEQPYHTLLSPLNNHSCDNKTDPDRETDSNLTAECCETEIPFVDFNRRNKGSYKLSIELKGNGKKRRLIRPPLKLQEERSDLHLRADINQPDMKLGDTSQEGFQGHDKDMNLTADINEILAFIESESNKLKQHFESESNKLTSDTDACPDKTSDKLVVANEPIVETRTYNPPTILVSNCQKPAAFKSNEATTVSEPVIQIEESCKPEPGPEPDNSKLGTCLHNEKSNRAEPKARDLIISLVSCMAKSKSKSGKEDLALNPFSCQTSKPVEDFIPLEPYDENSRETFEYREITVE